MYYISLILKYFISIVGRSRGTISVSLPGRTENFSMRQRSTSVAQNSFKGLSYCNVAEAGANCTASSTDIEEPQDKLAVTENIELQINIQQSNGDQESKVAEIKNAFLRSLPCSRNKSDNKENVSIVETVLIKCDVEEKEVIHENTDPKLKTNEIS